MSNTHLFLKSTFLNTTNQNGVGRYVCQLQRIVLKFCKHHGTSRGMREFIEGDLVNFAKENPGVVVYLKPRRHRSAVIVAEYLNGSRQHMIANSQTPEVIAKWMELFKSQQENHEGVRLRKLMHTDRPSIQGPWNPYTFKDPKNNLAEFPNRDLGEMLDKPKTATEQLLDIFKKQQGQIESLEKKRAE